MGKRYRVNPICPVCGEEHISWTITLTDEEQKELDDYYRKTAVRREEYTDFGNLLCDFYEKPLRVTRKFECFCNAIFEATVTVLRQNEVS